ncbi:MAG: AMP-dependent synthetase/ligase [Acidimicrobiia bacterium]
MQQFTTPGEATLEPTDNPITALRERAQQKPAEAALAYRDGDVWVDVTAQELHETALEIAAGLVALGIEQGSRIALFCESRIEFTYFDYAIWAAGCATVTIYETDSAEQVEWITGNSEAVAIIASNDSLRAQFDAVADRLPDVRHAFVIDNGAVEQIKGLATDEARAEVERRIAAIDPNELATLVYTSGTTGKPKGCILTHRNFMWEVRQVINAAPELFTAGRSTYQFLPLAHVLGRVVQVACVSGGIKIAFSTGVKNLTEELPMVKPDFVVSVPRVFEKIYNGAKQKADSEGKGTIFDMADRTAEDYSRGLDSGKVSLRTRLLHPIFDRLVYSKLRAITGGNLEYAISGGAPLGERLGHFFRGVGITALEGYGLTETTAGISINTPQALRIGSVGRPFPGASAKVAEDGELLLRGGGVFQGYWKNDAATEEVFTEDGWFRSGDIGEIDSDGFIRITGRKKELLVTAGGKNVAPAVLEDRLRAHPLVSQVMVIGDGQPFIAALVTIDEESFPIWAAEHEKEGKTIADLGDDPELNESVQAAVDEANQAVSRAESIRTFRILPEDLTIEGGELTPTLKVKRDIVMKKYASVVDTIYTG